jgi:hypothetical protein
LSWLSTIFQRKQPASFWTGKTYTANEFRAALGVWDMSADSTYAEIRASELPKFYTWYQEKLFDLGLVRWDARADCDNFANLYTDLFQLRFYLAQWDSNTLPAAESVAVASFWYTPDNSKLSHAINAVLTDEGLIFVEPQTGNRKVLSPHEKSTVFRCIF